jgi:hypothetical protein
VIDSSAKGEAEGEGEYIWDPLVSKVKQEFCSGRNPSLLRFVEYEVDEGIALNLALEVGFRLFGLSALQE